MVPKTTAMVPKTTAVVPKTTAMVPNTTAMVPKTTAMVPKTIPCYIILYSVYLLINLGCQTNYSIILKWYKICTPSETDIFYFIISINGYQFRPEQAIIRPRFTQNLKC